MGAISATDIISIIQSEIENFNWDEASRETGNVIWVGDGIATVYGIDHAMYGEIVVFDNGVKGMVQDIRQNEIGVILFGRDHGIHEGTSYTLIPQRIFLLCSQTLIYSPLPVTFLEYNITYNTVFQTAVTHFP